MEELKKPSKRELVDMLAEMNKNIENLPQHAMIGFITNYDLSDVYKRQIPRRIVE